MQLYISAQNPAVTAGHTTPVMQKCPVLSTKGHSVAAGFHFNQLNAIADLYQFISNVFKLI